MIFSEVKIFQPSSFEDYRGELYTLFNQDEHELIFNHDKVAVSRQHVLRGLHGDDKAWKLITCVDGEIYLVIVDNRPESPNYLKWDSIVLTASNKKYDWLDWDKSSMCGKVLNLPAREMIPENIKEQLIVELYSK